MILRHMRKKEQRKTIPLHLHLHHRNRKGPRIRHCLRTLGSLSPNLLSLRTNLAGWNFILSVSFDSKAFLSGPNIRSNKNHQGRVQGAAGGQEAKDHQGAERARDSPENCGDIMLQINLILCHQYWIAIHRHSIVLHQNFYRDVAVPKELSGNGEQLLALLTLAEVKDRGWKENVKLEILEFFHQQCSCCT